MDQIINKLFLNLPKSKDKDNNKTNLVLKKN